MKLTPLKITRAIKMQLGKLGVPTDMYEGYTREGLAYLKSKYKERKNARANYDREKGSSK